MTTATITDAQIDAALERCPFPKYLSGKYAAALAKALGLEPVKGCWSEQVRAHGAELVRRVIERAITGNPAGAAHFMVLAGHASAEWACRVIERATTGNPAWVAYRMVRDGYASAKWADRVRQAQDKRERGEA